MGVVGLAAWDRPRSLCGYRTKLNASRASPNENVTTEASNMYGRRFCRSYLMKDLLQFLSNRMLFRHGQVGQRFSNYSLHVVGETLSVPYLC